MDILSKTDAVLRIYESTKNGWNKIHTTEKIFDNLNPDFAKSIVLDYIFEIDQQFKVECIDDDGNGKFDFIGEATFELGELMGSKNNLLILPLIHDKKTMKKGGKLIVRSEEVSQNNESVTFHLKCSGLDYQSFWGSAGTPFMVIYKPRHAKGNPGSNADWLKVHQTEFYGRDSKDPEFKKFSISSSKLCGSDPSMR
jgi:hypothetical protein